jgi:hypothetical protein
MSDSKIVSQVQASMHRVFIKHMLSQRYSVPQISKTIDVPEQRVRKIIRDMEAERDERNAS